MLKAQGVPPTGPLFCHHRRLDPERFVFALSLPVAADIAAQGRVHAGLVPARTVACTVYSGGYEGLPAAWGEFMTWLYVAPAWQRLGIGRRLLAEAIGRIGPQAWTSAIAHNAPAIALYRKAGFDVVSVRPGRCEGYACTGARLALPTSRMHDPMERRIRDDV